MACCCQCVSRLKRGGGALARSLATAFAQQALNRRLCKPSEANPRSARPTNRCIRRAQPPPRSTPCIITVTPRARRASLACRAHEPRASAACGRRGTCVLAAAVAATRATQRGPAARDAPRSPPARAAQAPAIARVADASQRHVGMSVACGTARCHQARGCALLGCGTLTLVSVLRPRVLRASHPRDATPASEPAWRVRLIPHTLDAHMAVGLHRHKASRVPHTCGDHTPRAVRSDRSSAAGARRTSIGRPAAGRARPTETQRVPPKVRRRASAQSPLPACARVRAC